MIGLIVGNPLTSRCIFTGAASMDYVPHAAHRMLGSIPYLNAEWIG